MPDDHPPTAEYVHVVGDKRSVVMSVDGAVVRALRGLHRKTTAAIVGLWLYLLVSGWRLPMTGDEVAAERRREHASECAYKDQDRFADHPCGKPVIVGVTRCDFCGNLDGSPDCHCWQPMTEELLDGIYLEAWGIHNDAEPTSSDRGDTGRKDDHG